MSEISEIIRSLSGNDVDLAPPAPVAQYAGSFPLFLYGRTVIAPSFVAGQIFSAVWAVSETGGRSAATRFGECVT